MQYLSRRAALAGLSVLAAGPIRAQESAQAEPSFGLLTNLFTRIAAHVEINRAVELKLVIDTGAGRTALAEDIASRLTLPPGPPVMVHGLTEARLTPTVRIAQARLQREVFLDLECPVLPRQQLGADGLIGLDMLSRFSLSFDLAARRANLSAHGVSIVMRGGSVGTRLTDGVKATRGAFGQLLFASVFVDGQPTTAFIDSGAQYSIGNPELRRAIAAQRPEADRRARRLPLYGVTGQTVDADLLQVDELRIAGARVGATPLLFADLHAFRTLGLSGEPALVLGADVLGRFREITLDFATGAIQFRGLRRSLPTPPGGT